MENQKPKYDIDDLLKEVSTGNDPLQPEPQEIEIKFPNRDGSISTIALPSPVSF